MDIAISGASGFIGQALIKKFRQLGWTIRIINRESFLLSDEAFTSQKIDGTDVVINLAGAPLAARWTAEYKELILTSRVKTTLKIAEAIKQARSKPGAFLCSSAIGIYSQEGMHNENSLSFADSYLGKVCREWEKAAMTCQDFTRVLLFRTGLVLGKDGGALQKMHTPFSIGLGGKIGSGKQSVSFIHITDLIDAIIFMIENPTLQGPVNAVSPYPTTNYEFSDTLGKALKQPVWFSVPAFALKMAYGEGAQVLLEGQKVYPEKLLGAGFRFKYPTILNALVEIYR